ncbi:class I SAM-dependent methyltransferase [Corynebacterium rouxii]|uniref:Class I SAM-dependent methyltransferase n=1 Tax=Corynebacterium rouxii TaxID=2719119 RepID=A0A6I8MFK4_9CORY|nr:class I SAM-dependent methyltransferase [Corynebacterium rouxii]VZH85090.1 class I SAM-dependent methyltransferase [Corynebacterium rouxii]
MSTTHNSLPASSDKHHDERGEASLYYDSHGHVWSGNPNYTLTQLIPELKINLGYSLDIGSGEGADVAWLAGLGWRAVGLEPSDIAVERSRELASNATFIQGQAPQDLDRCGGPFDLVTGFYIPVAGEKVWRDISRQVADGGYLIYVHHNLDELRAKGHPLLGRDDLLMPFDAADLAPSDAWDIVVRETRHREIAGGHGHHHHLDDVVVLKRRMK